MDSFAKWLTDQDSTQAPDLKQLQDFAKNPASKWPFWSNKLSAYLGAIRATESPPSPQLLETLENAYTRWIRESQPAGKSLGERFFGSLGIILPSIAALLFMGGIYYGLASSDFYSSLAKTEQGRGLITFVFALTATGVILLVSIGIFFYENTDDLMRRIVPAKDVLTVVIGVLGTIMGFYFGSAVDGRMTISNISLAPAIATSTDKPVKFQARVIGGTGPYQYTIAFGDSSIAPISKSSTTSTIEETLDISKLPAGTTNVTITIAITDARGNQAHSATVLVVQPAGAAAPGQKGPVTPPTAPPQSGTAPVTPPTAPPQSGTAPVTPPTAPPQNGTAPVTPPATK